MLLQKIHQNIIRNPNKIAVIDGSNKCSYKELFFKTLQICSMIKKISKKKNINILISLENSIELICIFLANLILKNKIIPIDYNMKSVEIKNNFKNIKIDLIITNSLNKPILNKILNKECLVIDNLAKTKIKHSKTDISERLKNNKDFEFIVSSSSGTSGNPKKIVLTEKIKLNRAINCINTYNIKKSYNNLICTPLHHTLAQRIMFVSLINGSTIFIENFSPLNFLNIIRKKKINFSMMVSLQLQKVFSFDNIKKSDFKSLKCLVSSSESLDVKLKRKIINEFKINLHEIYGLSESGTLTNLNISKNQNKILSVGKPIDQTEIKIINKNNGIGEITFKSPRIFKKYLGENKINKNQYFKTGDLGYLDKDNFLFFKGRKKDIIRYNGINVFPKIIEKSITEINEVENCAVIGIRNKKFGEFIMACIQLKKLKKISIRDIQFHCLENLSYSHQPLVYKILEKLPKNKMGKILKKKLTKRFAHIMPSKKYY